MPKEGLDVTVQEVENLGGVGSPARQWSDGKAGDIKRKESAGHDVRKAFGVR